MQPTAPVATTPPASDQHVSGRSSAPRLGRRVVSGVRWNLVDQALQQALRIVITVTLARLLLPREFGVAAVAFIVSDLAKVFGDVGVAPTLVFVKALRQDHVRTAVTAGLVVGSAMTALVVVSAPAVARFFQQPEVRPVLVVMSAIFVMKGLVAPVQSLWRRDLEFRPFVVSNAIAVTVAGAAAVVAAFAGGGVWALVTYSLGEAFVGLAAAYVIVMRAGRYDLRPGFDRTAFRELSSFGAAVSGTRLVLYGRQNLDNVIVGRALGATALGFYDFAYNLMLYPVQRMSNVVTSVSFSAFAQLRDERLRLALAYTRALRVICVVAFPISFASSVAAPLYVPVVFGDRWRPAVTTVQVLALNGVRLSMTTLNGTVMESTGRPQWNLMVNLGLLAVAVPGFVVGVHFGIVGVAVAFTAAGCAALPVSMSLAGRRLGLPLRRQLHGLSVPVVASALMVAVMEALMLFVHGHLPRSATLFLVIAVGAAVYLLVVARLDRVLLHDAVSSVIHRRRRREVKHASS